jgi:hypothetical protein
LRMTEVIALLGRAMRERCKSRHVGPVSIGVHRSGQFRCENCDAVLNGVEVYLDTTEHAANGKDGSAGPPRNQFGPPIDAFLKLEPFDLP